MATAVPDLPARSPSRHSSPPFSPKPAGSGPRPIGFDFVAEPFTIHQLPPVELPYVTGRVTPLQAKPPTDAEGIRQYRAADGRLYDHPVNTAQEILRLLDSFSSGGGSAYLAAAMRNADRLLAIAVEVDGAIYFPYLFDFALGGNPNDLMVAPCYSAMAEGQALSSFVRLFQVTGDERWKTAAERTFATFTRPRSDDGPWTVFVDAAGYLWFEEYAKNPPMQVLNGHIFALFGVFEYFELTESPTALEVLRGGLTTVKHYAEAFRNPGSVSAYDLRVRFQNPKYHAIHVKQLRLLARITGDGVFDAFADEFQADSPPIPIAESEA